MTWLDFFMIISLVSVGSYLLLGKNYADILIGMVLLSNGVNVTLINSGRNIEGVTDPLPRALILTAIVIGFAVVTFLSAFALKHTQSQATNSNPETDKEYKP